MNKKNILLAVVVIGVAVALYFWMSAAPSADHEPSVVEQPSGESETVTPKPVETLTPVSAPSLGYLLPADWEFTPRAQTGVQGLAPEQTIQFGIVPDPSSDKVFYFSTIAPAPDVADAFLVSIYRYHTDTYAFERLFRGTYGKGDFAYLHDKAIVVFHILGIDNGRLVLLAMDYDSSPGPCTEPLLLGTDEERGDMYNMLSMSIDDPYSGFEEYTPSADLLADAKAREETCTVE